MHQLAQIIRFRMLMIAAGYEDGNDAATLRRDPMFKLALDRLPSDEELWRDSRVLGRAAIVLGRFGEDIDAALALIDRALSLNPSFAQAWYWSGSDRCPSASVGIDQA